MLFSTLKMSNEHFSLWWTIKYESQFYQIYSSSCPSFNSSPSLKNGDHVLKRFIHHMNKSGCLKRLIVHQINVPIVDPRHHIQLTQDKHGTGHTVQLIVLIIYTVFQLMTASGSFLSFWFNATTSGAD